MFSGSILYMDVGTGRNLFLLFYIRVRAAQIAIKDYCLILSFTYDRWFRSYDGSSGAVGVESGSKTATDSSEVR